MELSEAPVTDVTVKIYSWDWKEWETITLTEPSQTVPISVHDAHYLFSASFDGPNGSTYEVTFCFDISSNSM